jgi:predicted amidohydrolase YtcJ
VVNSKALAAAGIDRNTKIPDGGAINKDASGEPDGMIRENATQLIKKIIPPVSHADRAKSFRAAFAYVTSHGWTGAHDMWQSFDDVLMLEGLAQKGELPLHVYNAVRAEDANRLLEAGPRSAADGRVITRAVKFFMDGARGQHGAAMLEPYADANTTGLVVIKKDEVLPVWERALRQGIQIATHASGDRGARLVLDWYEAAFKAVPGRARKVNPPRWRVEHASIVAPSDVPRFAKLGVIPSMQPNFALDLDGFMPNLIGLERMNEAFAWKSMINAGSIVSAGSDAPTASADPLVGFYAAVARKTLDGRSGPGFHPEEAVDRQTALKMYTAWPAFTSFRENELGTIKAGMRADFTVFSKDLMTVPKSEILAARALLTVLDGKEAFHAEGW